MTSGAVAGALEEVGGGSAFALLGATELTLGFASAGARAASGAGALSTGVTARGDFGGGAAHPVSPEEGGAPPTINAVAASAYG